MARRSPPKTLERKLLQNYKHIIAVDEVGMGCLAGPVVVCAVKFDKKFFRKKWPKLHGLRDSKLLSSKKREKFSRELLWIPGFKFQICYSYPKTIDKLNIYQASRLAMKRAVNKMQKFNIKNQNDKSKFRSRKNLLQTIVLVDGPHKISGLDLNQIPIIRGDRKVFAIACASIIAKVYRDKMMRKYAKRYPGYGFERHKGYGTKLHQARLAKQGLCDLHRRSFALVS